MDHLFNIGFVRTRLDDRPYYHPLAILTFLAASTASRLGTSVLVLPYHNPVELAKYAATLDQLSKGRLILGVGAGAMVEEFEALGVSLHERASLTNESIAVMKELWTKRRAGVPRQALELRRPPFRAQADQQPHMPRLGRRRQPRRHEARGAPGRRLAPQRRPGRRLPPSQR